MDQSQSDLLDAYIQCWLDSITAASPQTHTNKDRAWSSSHLDMPSLRVSSSAPERSPKPHRANQGIEDGIVQTELDNAFDHDKTPSASPRETALSLPARPVLRQTPSLSSASSFNPSSKARSESPVKRSTLELLKKPLFLRPLEDDPSTQLPADMLQTYDRLIDITLNHVGILSRSVEQEMQSTHRKNTIKPWWFFEDDHDVAGKYDQELRALCEIERKAKICQTEQSAESTWNLEVHGPLLELAFRPHSPFPRRELMTAAHISKPFKPEIQDGSMYDCTRGKMIDWGVRICPVQPLASRIREAIVSMSESQRCINQTTYGPVRYGPIAMVIETKIGIGLVEEARLQLGIWIAPWHQRLSILKTNKRIVTIPLIIVIEHEWRLLFACDKGDCIELAISLLAIRRD